MPSNPTIPRTCRWCQSTFLARPADINRGGAKFCSRQCASRWGASRKPVRPNAYRIEGDVTFLALTDRSGATIAEALIDTERLPDMARYRWALAGHGYVTCARVVDGESVQLYLHRVILGLESGDPTQADHINRNKLDNRRANLRPATAASNSQNRKHPPASRYPGVTWDKITQRWMVQAYQDGKRIWLGRHDTEIEAARVSLAWRSKHPPKK